MKKAAILLEILLVVTGFIAGAFATGPNNGRWHSLITLGIGLAFLQWSFSPQLEGVRSERGCSGGMIFFWIGLGLIAFSIYGIWTGDFLSITFG